MSKRTFQILVDPPSGWRYGFPTPLEEDYEQQLRNAGYPEKDIPFALKHSRFLGRENMSQKEFIEECRKANERLDNES